MILAVCSQLKQLKKQPEKKIQVWTGFEPMTLGWGGGGGGGVGCLTPRSKPLPFHIPFLTEKAALSYTFHWKWYPFHIAFTFICLIYFERPFFAVFPTFFMLQLVFSLLFPILHEIPTLSQTSTREIPTLSYTSSLKKVPLLGRASPYSPL